MNSNEKSKHLQGFLRDKKTYGQTLLSNTGYVNLVFSRCAAQDPSAKDKLAICCTFEEWRAIGELLKCEAAIPWSGFCTSGFIAFLIEAINSIPSQESTIVPSDSQLGAE